MKPLVPYSIEVMNAIRAVASGTANEGQQKTAWTWIINDASDWRRVSYAPGIQPVDIGFAEGRRFVGSAAVDLLREDAPQRTIEAVSKAPQSKRQEASE